MGDSKSLTSSSRHVLAYDLTATLFGLAGMDVGVGLTGGDGDVGLHQGEVIAVEIAILPVGRLKDNADAGGKSGFSGDEESAVGSQAGSIAFHLGIADIEVVFLVEQPDHEGGIARTASQSGL